MSDRYYPPRWRDDDRLERAMRNVPRCRDCDAHIIDGVCDCPHCDNCGTKHIGGGDYCAVCLTDPQCLGFVAMPEPRPNDVTRLFGMEAV